jgi:hypothetical protein
MQPHSEWVQWRASAGAYFFAVTNELIHFTNASREMSQARFQQVGARWTRHIKTSTRFDHAADAVSFFCLSFIFLYMLLIRAHERYGKPRHHQDRAARASDIRLGPVVSPFKLYNQTYTNYLSH